MEARPRSANSSRNGRSRDLEPRSARWRSGRNFESGKAAFNDAQCIACHRFGNEGGAVGPELDRRGAASIRGATSWSPCSNRRKSSRISSRIYNIVKTDGDDVTGRIMDENAERLIVLPNMLAPETTVEVRLADIARRQPSKVSPMPTGLAEPIDGDEILDLLAYIESAGNANAVNFKK